MEEEKKDMPQPAAPLSEARKAALLRYMAILFAVAFLLVLLSLILQTHSSKSTISELSAASMSALDNAVKLQEENRSLQEEKQSLKDELSQAQQQLEEETARGETLLEQAEQAGQAEQAQRKAAEQELTHTKAAYEALLTAMRCQTREGNVTFSRAMETVERYKDYLDEAALAEYEKLLEQ